MTNNDAIRAMQFYKQKLFNGIFNQYIEAFDVAIDALREKGATMEWISVEDRLPENGMVVLCYSESHFDLLSWEVLAWDSAEKWWFSFGRRYSKSHITHWMPLPLPPEK